jgi:excisionase family DNA binding protein
MARSNVVQFPTAQKIEHYQSTQQAADFLNVSQPYFDELLSKGEIPFRRVGAESLVVVKIKDVISYKKQEIPVIEYEPGELEAELNELRDSL